MSDAGTRALERVAAVAAEDDEDAKNKAGRERCRVEGCKHEYEGSACRSCAAPDPRTVPKGRGRSAHRFGCRRWAGDAERPGEAFEVFDRVTGKCASFPGPRAAIERAAAQKNRWRRAHPGGGECHHGELCPAAGPKRLVLKEGSRTPWGKADSAQELAPGIWNTSTPSHGGIKLDKDRNAQIPEACRREGGWYEEDAEAYIPMAAFLDEIRAAWPHVTHDAVVAGLARNDRRALAALVAAGRVSMTPEALAIVARDEAREAKARAARESGQPLRVAALGLPDGRVHVLFSAPGVPDVGRYMSQATYDAIPLSEPATVVDYEAHGPTEPAPDAFKR